MIEQIENLMVNYPRTGIIIVSFIVTLIMTLVTKYFTNQKRIRELKKMQKACQLKLKDKKGDLKAQGAIQKEMMQCSMEMMKYSMKPMLITFIPIIIFFGWFRGVYAAAEFGWFWWYMGTSIASSILLRKVMNVA